MIKVLFGIACAIYPFLVFYLIVIQKTDSQLLSLFAVVFAMFAFFAITAHPAGAAHPVGAAHPAGAAKKKARLPVQLTNRQAAG